MKKFMIIVMLIPVVVFSQSTIPYPTGINTYREDLPDNPPHTNIYIIANSNAKPAIRSSQSIGDFNGNNSDEIYSTWRMSADYHWTNNGNDSVQVNGTDINGYAVYSLKTQSILIYELRSYSSGGSYPTEVKTGDFNGDGCIDYVIVDKIYTTTTPIKKKLP